MGIDRRCPILLHTLQAYKLSTVVRLLVQGSLGIQVLRDARGVFVAGCCFDELPPSVIMEAVTSARSAGAAIFFDPGPRSWTFREPQRRRALDELLDSTDVVLMTEVCLNSCSCCCSSLLKRVPVSSRSGDVPCIALG